MSSELLSQRGSEAAPASFLCRSSADGDSHLCLPSGRAVLTIGGREKQTLDPEWNRRIARLGGRDVHGVPIWKLTWGWNETLQLDCRLRFPHVASQWLLLRLMPAWTWGSRAMWYAPRVEDGRWAPSFAEEFGEEYPARGAYEIHYAFPLGVRPRMQFVEDLIRAFNNRPKVRSYAQMMREDRAAIEAEEMRIWQQDYERAQAANPAFYGEPFRGYGQKSGDRSATSIPTMTPGMVRAAKSIVRSRTAKALKRGVN